MSYNFVEVSDSLSGEMNCEKEGDNNFECITNRECAKHQLSIAVDAFESSKHRFIWIDLNFQLTTLQTSNSRNSLFTVVRSDLF